VKKILIAIVVFLLSACATTVTKNAALVSKSTLSVERFVNTCGIPAESYFIQRLGVRVHRHKNCMGVGDLLSLVWTGDISQQSVDSIYLLAITYASYLTRIDQHASYLVNLLKIDSFTQNNIETYVAFFKIKRKINK